MSDEITLTISRDEIRSLTKWLGWKTMDIMEMIAREPDEARSLRQDPSAHYLIGIYDALAGIADAMKAQGFEDEHSLFFKYMDEAQSIARLCKLKPDELEAWIQETKEANADFNPEGVSVLTFPSVKDREEVAS